MKSYDRSLELDPADAPPWNGKGYALENQGDWAAAVEAYGRVIALDPQSAEAKQNRQRAGAKAQGSANGPGPITAMPAGELVSFVDLLALIFGVIGLAGKN